MSWTDDRVELLKKLWGEGKTAAEIANALGDTTRNAVIGKAHRLKLSGRVSPIQQNKKPANTSSPKAKTPPKEEIKKIVVKNDNRRLVSLIDLKKSMCCWPLGDPKHKDFGFCGGDIHPGLPYCAEHAQIAYQAATRNRILKDVKNTAQPKTEKKKASA